MSTNRTIKWKFLGIGLFFAVLTIGQVQANSIPASYYKSCIPDFTQKLTPWYNIDEEWNFCGPTSAANSLFWMSQQYNLPKLRQWYNSNINSWVFYDGQFGMIEDLAENYMGFTMHHDPNIGDYYEPYDGVSDSKFINGKWDFIQDRYPQWITEKYFDADLTSLDGVLNGVQGTPPSLDWIKSELYKCEDVEIGITYLERIDDKYYLRGGHWMTLVGWNETQLGFHDPYWDRDPTPVWKDYPGLAFDHWAYDDYYNFGSINLFGTDFLTLNYSANRICVIDIAVSESYVPEPATISAAALLFCLTGLKTLRRYRRKTRQHPAAI